MKKSNLLKTAIYILFVLFVSSAHAEKSDILGNYLNILANENPELKATLFKYKSVLNKAETEKYLPDPVFTTGLYLQSIETKVGSQKAKFGITQKIPFKGKLKLKRLGEIEKAKAIWELYKQKKLTLISEFKKNYFMLCYLNEQEKIVNSHIKLLSEISSITEAGYKTGKNSYFNLLKIETELDKTRDRLQTIIQFKKPIIAKLNQLLNRPADSPITVVSLDLFKTPELENSLAKQLEKSLFETNPEIKSLGFEIKSRRIKKDLIYKNRYPDFFVGLDWIATSYSGTNIIQDAGKDGIILKFGVTVPLWRKKYKLADKSADYNYLEAIKKQVAVKNQKEFALQKAFFDYYDGKRKFKLYREKIIPKAEESLNVLLSAYKVGDADFLDILDGERILLEFKLNLIKAKKDILTAMAEIEKISGKNLFEINKNKGVKND